jgi:hypothetical protein
MLDVGDIVRSEEVNAIGVVTRVSESCIAGTRIYVSFGAHDGEVNDSFWCTVHDLELVK